MKFHTQKEKIVDMDEKIMNDKHILSLEKSNIIDFDN